MIRLYIIIKITCLLSFGNNNKNNKILSYQKQSHPSKMSQHKQQTSVHASNELSTNQVHLNPQRNITVNNQSSNNHIQNNRIENAQQMPHSQLQSKTIDDSLKSSGNHFTNKLNGDRSLKRGFASNNNVEPSKVRYSNKKYNTLKTNDNIKRIQRLYTDTSGQQQIHSRLLLPTNSQNSYVHKSLIQSYSEQEAKQSQQYNKQHPPNLTKQELYEQNMKLKNKINEMKDTLTRQKIQTEIQKKKNKKYTMQLNRQFKKQLYINNMRGLKVPQEASEQQRIAKLYTNQQSDPQNQQVVEKSYQFSEMLPKTSYYRIPASLGPPSLQPHSNQYMIAGIKQKYEQLKIEYEKTIKELKMMKATDAVKKLQEVSVYCVTLEQSNCRLAVALDVAKKKLYAYQNPDGHPLQGKNKDMQAYSEAVITQLSNKIQSLKLKSSIRKQQNKKFKQEQKQNEKLIKYLQSILTSKSTLLYNQQRALKKTSSAIKQIQNQLAQQKKGSQIMKQSYLTQMQQISGKYEAKIKKQKNIFQEALIQKNFEIKKLQKQIGYLNMIVDNWRGSDDKEKEKVKQKQQKQKDLQSISTAKKRKQSTLNGNLKMDLENGSDKNSASNNFIKYTERRQLQKQYDQKVNQLASYTNRVHSNSREEQILQRTNTQKDGLKHQQRKRKSSGFKNSENAKKLRKVPIQQIIDLAQFIRYRLIGSKKSINDITQLLSYKPQQTEDPQTIKWKNQYITQGELTKLFQSQPFMIPQPMGNLLSRYVIEDECVYESGSTDNAFVYADPVNEIQRIVAKSILKAFIQAVSSAFINQKNVSSVFQQCEKQWSGIIEKYGNKINTPLISIASSGFISKQRWGQLLTSLNIEASEQVRQWCIGNMLLQSQSLNKLKYRSIVPEYI